MTEAAFISFVKGHLRRASRWWKPITDTLKKARLQRGLYRCNVCQQEVTASILVDKKRVKNIYVDHINPVVDPITGFSGWDDFINNLFCEPENLQAICYHCHNEKTKEERNQAKEARKKKNESTIQ